MTSGPVLRTAVLILGDDPSALTLAIELGCRSIPCMLIDQNANPSAAFRTARYSSFTTEYLRQRGLSEEFDTLAHPQAPPASSLPPLIRTHPYSENFVQQGRLEKLLVNYLRSIPHVTFQQGFAMHSLTQNHHIVTTTIRDKRTGLSRTIASNYLVSAEAANHVVREAVCGQSGESPTQAYACHIVFRAREDASIRLQESARKMACVDAHHSLIGPSLPGNLWTFTTNGVASLFDEDDRGAMALLGAAVGRAAISEIIHVDQWSDSMVARRFRDRRVFLIGDACGRRPSLNGVDIETGMADATDLGWKISAVLGGWGGPTLLDTYEPERRACIALPAATTMLCADRAPNDSQRDSDECVPDSLATGSTESAFKRCQGLRDAILLADKSPRQVGSKQGIDRSAAVGARAPNMWFSDGSSLFDTFGAHFTFLILGTGAQSDINAIHTHAATLGVPLAIENQDATGLTELYGCRYALVRPDNVVAWRGNAWPSDGKVILRRITGFTQPLHIPSH